MMFVAAKRRHYQGTAGGHNVNKIKNAKETSVLRGPMCCMGIKERMTNLERIFL